MILSTIFRSGTLGHTASGKGYCRQRAQNALYLPISYRGECDLRHGCPTEIVMLLGGSRSRGTPAALPIDYNSPPLTITA